jgi:hypothetical protein
MADLLEEGGWSALSFAYRWMGWYGRRPGYRESKPLRKRFVWYRDGAFEGWPATRRIGTTRCSGLGSIFYLPVDGAAQLPIPALFHPGAGPEKPGKRAGEDAGLASGATAEQGARRILIACSVSAALSVPRRPANPDLPLLGPTGKDANHY